jgi:phosphohistidine phosphatase
MRTLLVLRHAEAEPGAAYASDHERPLSARGAAAARAVGAFLARSRQVPGRVVTSSALRARSTAELAAGSGGFAPVIEVEAALYGGSPGGAIALVNRFDDATASALLVGHEPAWSELVAELCGARVAFPAAALARIDFHAESWDEVAAREGRLVWLVVPALLGAKLGVGY